MLEDEQKLRRLQFVQINIIKNWYEKTKIVTSNN